MTGSRDRGQAFTLESLVAALLLLTALLFALQAVVITPTSAGSLDRDTQAELLQESSDTLVTAENEGELSRMARFWEQDSNGNWVFADGPNSTSGPYVSENIGYERDLLPVQDLGESLNHTVREGNQYNVVLAYQTPDGNRETIALVYQGTPGQEVVTTSYAVTLTDDQLVTGPDEPGRTLEQANSTADVPILDLNAGPVYNVVEVRLVLW